MPGGFGQRHSSRELGERCDRSNDLRRVIARSRKGGWVRSWYLVTELAYALVPGESISIVAGWPASAAWSFCSASLERLVRRTVPPNCFISSIPLSGVD